MTYYIGLLLEDRAIIAADKRVTGFVGGTWKRTDTCNKISQVSPHTYLCGAGNMNACYGVFKYLKAIGFEYVEEIQKINCDEFRRIYNQEMERAKKEIPNFEQIKDKEGYLNVSIMLGGISRGKEPILRHINNQENFVPKILQRCLSGTATNMTYEINKITDNFHSNAKMMIRNLNEDSKGVLVTNLLKKLFREISEKDESVSPECDVLILDKDSRPIVKTYEEGNTALQEFFRQFYQRQ